MNALKSLYWICGITFLCLSTAATAHHDPVNVPHHPGDATPEALQMIGQDVVAANGHTGKHTAVAIFDGGFDWTNDSTFGNCMNPAGVVDSEGWAPVSPDGSCKIAWVQCFMGSDCNISNSDGHGEFVSRVVLGVAPNTKLLMLEAAGFEANIVAGVEWLTAVKSWPSTADQTPVERFNIVATSASSDPRRISGKFSWEIFKTGCSADALADEADWFNAWSTLRAHGVLPVASAGNSGTKGGVFFTGCSGDLLMVGSVFDRDWDQVINFGTLGIPRVHGQMPCLQVNPRAGEITCYSNNDLTLVPILAPGSLGGTSGAAPYVAGAVAVLRAPDVWAAATADQTQDLLTSTGVATTDDRACSAAEGSFGSDPYGIFNSDENNVHNWPPTITDQFNNANINSASPYDWLPAFDVAWGYGDSSARWSCLYDGTYKEPASGGASFLRGKDFDPVTVAAGDIWPKDPDLYWDDIPAYDTPRLQLDEAVAMALRSRQKIIESGE